MSLPVALGLGALLLVLLLVLLLRPRRRPAPRRSASAPARPAAPAAADATPAAAPAPLPPAPPLRRAEALDAPARQALLDALQQLPRPPRALQRLLAPDFVQRAASAELAELVLGEPVVAARVLAAVNAPLYGLQQPVASIGQAITFLGLSSVRGLVLQYLLDEAFKSAGDAALQQEFDRLWRASAIAGELCQPLAQRLQLGEPGSLMTQLVLSFLGRFASALLLRQRGLPLTGHASAQQRCQAQQQALGLAEGEIGFLLMQAWGLPEGLTAEVRLLGQLPSLRPAELGEALHGARLTLAGVCALLGERIARGELAQLAGFDPLNDASPDFQALQAHLGQPRLARLGELLRGPEFLRLLARLG